MQRLKIGQATLLHILHIDTKGRLTPRGQANSPSGRLHEISAPFGLEVGLNCPL